MLRQLSLNGAEPDELINGRVELHDGPQGILGSVFLAFEADVICKSIIWLPVEFCIDANLPAQSAQRPSERPMNQR
jgi:hypothetical protein